MKRKTTLSIYVLYGIYILFVKFIAPSDQFQKLTGGISILFLNVNLLILMGMGILSIVIASDGRKFGLGKSQWQAIIPFLTLVGFVMAFLLVSWGSFYLQLTQGHLQADRNKVIEWVNTLNIQQTDEPVSYDLPEAYAYLSIDGKVSIIKDDYYLMVEFKYKGTLEDYEHVVYVNQDDVMAPAQYFHTTYGGIRIVKYWFWY